jgi:hypothetical protein
MFVGHYAASLALKKFEKRASLGMLFLAVQLVDILFFPFVLLGIERINIIENYTESTHFQLEYMPYTHSLLASLLWAAAAYALFRWVITKDRRIALVMAIAVFSHWVIDLLVHTPDLPIWSDASMKLGLGLWNNAVVTYPVARRNVAVPEIDNRVDEDWKIRHGRVRRVHAVDERRQCIRAAANR